MVQADAVGVANMGVVHKSERSEAFLVTFLGPYSFFTSLPPPSAFLM